MTTLRTTLVLALGGAASLVAAACGDSDGAEPAVTTHASVTTPAPSTTTAEAGAAAPLEGSTWTLAAASPLEVPLGDVVVTSVFDAGTLAGESGCNRYTTAYEVSDDALTVAPDIVVTEMACPEPQMAVEDEYLERLSRTATHTIDGSTLTLADADGGTLLVYGTTPVAEAVLGAWNVTSYYTGDAVASVVGGATLTVEFTTDGVAGDTGCNSFSGPYTVDGDAIEIGPLASTLAACPSDELHEQETEYLAALELATSIQVSGDRLDLFRSGGTFAATFERA
jgi:heat shock protein HslJ